MCITAFVFLSFFFAFCYFQDVTENNFLNHYRCQMERRWTKVKATILVKVCVCVLCAELSKQSKKKKHSLKQFLFTFCLDFEFSEADSATGYEASGDSFPMRVTYRAGGKINLLHSSLTTDFNWLKIALKHSVNILLQVKFLHSKLHFSESTIKTCVSAAWVDLDIKVNEKPLNRPLVVGGSMVLKLLPFHVGRVKHKNTFFCHFG